MDYEEPNNAIKAGALLRAASLQQASLGPAKVGWECHLTAGIPTQPANLLTPLFT